MGNSDLIKDLDAMSQVLAGTEPRKVEEKPPEPETEKKELPPPAEEKPAEPKPEEKPEEKQEEKKEEPETPPTPVKETPPPATDERDKKITELIAELAVLKAAQQTPPKPDEKSPEPPKIEDQDFIGELDLDDVTREPKEFNKLLNNVYQKGRAESEKAIIEQLPNMISQHVSTVLALQEAGRTFYESNKDLQPFKNVVRVVFDELAKENKNETFEGIMSKVAPEVRKRLNLPTQKAADPVLPEKKEDPGEKPPKLPGKSGSAGKAREQQKPDALQSEIGDMNDSLRR